MPSISRRTLLQGTGAMAVVGSLSGLIPETAHAMNSLGAKPELLNKRAGTVKYHSCLRNCADRCLMKFRVQDGRMTYVSGAEKQAKTGTCPCVKGLTYVEYTYAPDRILHPMERIGEKGSHKWRRITWEEAWAKLITKTKEVVAKYGPEAVLPYSYSGNYGAIGMHASGERFFNRLGASYLDRLVCTEAGVWGYGVRLTVLIPMKSRIATATSAGASTKPSPTCTASSLSIKCVTRAVLCLRSTRTARRFARKPTSTCRTTRVVTLGLRPAS